MAETQMQQPVNLGCTKVTHHKNQYSILRRQFLGKTCHEYMLLYNSISLFWHTTRRSASPLDYYETPVKAQGTFWVWRPALRPKHHCSGAKPGKHKEPQAPKISQTPTKHTKISKCTPLPHQKNKTPTQNHGTRKSSYSYKTRILHHLQMIFPVPMFSQLSAAWIKFYSVYCTL